MNKMRRKELADLIKQLYACKDKNDIYSVINSLENIRDDEEDYYDNIPENLQGGQRASDSESAIENMNEALDLLNEAYESDDDDIQSLVTEAIDKIDEARY